jgi:Putative beta-barrel porin-2, OmpL-like. bbp2/Carboxypeptidase regulatory-like domain
VESRLIGELIDSANPGDPMRHLAATDRRRLHKGEAMTNTTTYRIGRLLLAALIGTCATTATAATDTPGADVSSSIGGSVQDLAGTVITGAAITIRNVATDDRQTSTSDATGTFDIEHLAAGSYEITAAKPGFRNETTTVVVGAAQHADSALRLKTLDASVDPAMAEPKPSAVENLEGRIDQLEAELAKLKGAAGGAFAQAVQGTSAAPTVDTQTPFAFGDFTWLNGSPRNKKVAFDSPFFTPEVRFDSHYMQSFNNPIDHTMGGATESFRSGEVQVEQISVGGDFHMDNVRGRVLYMMGLFATTTPRNDASAAVGQWDVRGAYRNTSEAYGGYHFDVQHGLNVDAGIFVSYIGLFSYYNFDNWTYQPSYVSSNTPWFFNGVRVQWYPTNKLKIEPWFINGWQSYNKFNGRPGLGGQVLYQPTDNWKFVFNNYFNGTDTLGVPNRKRVHTDNSFEFRYYHKPDSTGLSQMAVSFTADYGCEYGGGVKCHGGDATTPSQFFAGWMAYNRFWFHKDLNAITIGGGQMTNPGRYLTLLPPINGADAISGSPYFPATPGSQAHQWDMTVNYQYMPKDFITFWTELGYRHSDVPYFSGRGGITPPGGNNGFPQFFVCRTGATSGSADLATAELACGGGADSLFFPDLRTHQTVVSAGIMVKF